MASLGAYEAYHWALTLKQKGFGTFTHKDLPDDLKCKKNVHKAAAKNYIEEVGVIRKQGRKIIQWRVTQAVFPGGFRCLSDKGRGRGEDTKRSNSATNGQLTNL